MRDLLILMAAVLITWLINQIPFVATMHEASRLEDEWLKPRFEKVDSEWVEACPYCGRPMEGE